MVTVSDVRDLRKTQDAPGGFRNVGPYRLDREIGRGATGVLYEAQHVEQGRKVAIKILDPNVIGEGKASRQDALFAREAMTLAKVPRHPGIVGILDAGIVEGLPFLVTEHVEGRPLSSVLQAGKQDLRALVRLLRDAALAVQHSHANKIVHRNLKPSNVIVDAAGRPHLTDFGSAKRIDPRQHQSTTYTIGGSIGTPAYMSPERAAGLKTVDCRTDLYSLGAILYEMLCGRPPFNLNGSVADLVTIVRGGIDAPSHVRPLGGTPAAAAAIEAICMKALSKSPDARHATAKEFADALTAWLGESAETGPAVPSRKAIAGAFLAAGLAAAAALAWFVLQG